MLTPAIFGISNSGVNLAIDLIILFLVVIWLALVYWTWADARRRIADPLLIGCATAASLFPFVGTLVYMIVRPPEYLEDVRERELEIQAAEARLAELGYHLCPHCDHEVEKDFLRCPNCMRKLRDPCPSCGKPLDPKWKICPFCEADLGAGTPTPRRTRRRRERDPLLDRPVAGYGEAAAPRGGGYGEGASPRTGAAPRGGGYGEGASPRTGAAPRGGGYGEGASPRTGAYVEPAPPRPSRAGAYAETPTPQPARATNHGEPLPAPSAAEPATTPATYAPTQSDRTRPPK